MKQPIALFLRPELLTFPKGKGAQMKALFILLASIPLCPSTLAATNDLIVSTGPLGSGQLFLPCSYDNHRDTCFLDTGSAFSAVVHNDFTAPYPSEGTIGFGGATGTPAFGEWIRIGAFSFAGLSVSNAKVVRYPESGTVFRSTIGIDQLQPHRILLDVSRQSMQLLPSGEASATYFQLRPERAGLISLPIQFGNTSIQALWDTGAGLSAVDTQYVETHPEEFEFISELGNGTDVTGSPVQLRLYRAKRIELASNVLSNVSVLAISFSTIHRHFPTDVRFIIGFNVISACRWDMDLPNKEWAADCSAREF